MERHTREDPNVRSARLTHGWLSITTAIACLLTTLSLTVLTAPPAWASDPLTFAGLIGLPRLDAPEGVAVDADGNVFVAERNTIGSITGDRLVKYDADGTFLDVIAGPPPNSSAFPTGEVADPSAVAVAPSGNVYVLEKYSNNDNRVQYFDDLGTYLGTWGDYGSGNGEFIHPEGIAVDSTGNVYVADTGNDRIQAFTSSGGLITSWGATNPTGVAVDGSDVVYVAGNNTIARYDTGGAPLSSWGATGAVGIAIDGSDNAWVTIGSAIKVYDNTGANLLSTYGSGVLSGAESISIAPSGKVYVADTGNGRIQRFSSAGATEVEWGQYPGEGVPDLPTGLAVDESGNVYMTKKATDEIQKFDADGNLLTEFGGHGNTGGLLDDPSGLAIGPDGNLYVADTTNQRIQKLTASGSYLAQWGSVGTSDGQVSDPAGIAVDATGNVYVADTGNNRIEEFSASGLFIRKWGLFGTENGNFKTPKGIAIDGSGHVWVADSGNNRIQEFTSTGTFIAKWGVGGSNDGNLSGPSDLEFDAEGTLWVVDKGHHRIQRFSTSGGFLSKLGGLATGLDIGQFSSPSAIAIDSDGRVLVADSGNNRVQVFVDLNGPDTTITGPGVATPSSSASFTLVANEPGSTFECKLDGGSYASCSSPKNYTSLPEGAHTFYARATDSLGHLGNPTQYPWTIDVTPPSASITSYPPETSGSTSASFSFTSNEPVGSTFLCARDTGTYAACTSPKTYSNLSSALHTFHVKAIDLAGNVGQAASYSWTVDTTPPTASILSGPSGYVQSATAHFSFSSPDTDASFTCRLDGGTYLPCSSPTTYTDLPAGNHSFAVRATDTFGNVGGPASRSWTVDLATHRPDGQIAAGKTYVGNNIYNSTGTNQTKTVKAAVGKTVVFKIRIENDGDSTDPFLVKGPGTANGYSLYYVDGTTDVTAKVKAGTYKVTLDPGASKVLTLKVKVTSAAAASKSVVVKVFSEREPTKLDAVKAVVKRA
jgi:sugar lactone lactonase YvrE